MAVEYIARCACPRAHVCACLCVCVLVCALNVHVCMYAIDMSAVMRTTASFKVATS